MSDCDDCCAFPSCRCEWEKRHKHCPRFGGTTKGYDESPDGFLSSAEHSALVIQFPGRTGVDRPGTVAMLAEHGHSAGGRPKESD